MQIEGLVPVSSTGVAFGDWVRLSANGIAVKCDEGESIGRIYNIVGNTAWGLLNNK